MNSAKRQSEANVRPINVLITAASRRVGLIRGFLRAVRRAKNPGSVITTDMNAFSPGLYFSDRHYMVPLTTNKNYIPIIKSICLQESVSLLIPTIDDEIPIFGAYREDFAAIGVKVACAGTESARICNDKYETFRFLKSQNIPVAETFLPGGDIPHSYPLFIKPRFGRGSVGAYPIRRKRDLDFFLEYIPEPVIQEYLEGREFTIDVCCDFEGQVIEVVPRERLVVRAGVSDRGITVKHPLLIEIGVRVATALKLVGAANIQVKLHGDRAKIFEINPRYAGGIPLTIAAGADFPAWQVRMAAGRKVSPRIGKFRDGLTMACFEDALFLNRDRLANQRVVDRPIRSVHHVETLQVQ